MFTTVLLTERQLSATDVRFVTTLHGAEPVSFLVLMRPREAEAVLLRAIDDVALGAFDQAVHERGESEGTDADAQAAEALERSLAALRAAGAEAVGRVVEGHPLEALEA
ncbi:indole-3-glycerol phosphate synthase, partial [Kitasatospora sp. SC0581]|uniref:indole-3-glycerol phosphate synthase n=1 Tax=Kitasatospora sp. SC0581 TaxID=3394360 RepID=UPI003A89B91F